MQNLHGGSELELGRFGEYLLKSRVVAEKYAPYYVRWVRRFRSNVETTMIYTHVVRDMRNPATSPLDLLSA